MYLDDVIVVGCTFREHLQKLQSVFGHLSTAGLKLQPNKTPLVLPLSQLPDCVGFASEPRKGILSQVRTKRKKKAWLFIINFIQLWDRLEVRDGVVWRVYDSAEKKRLLQLILPLSI